MNGICEAFEFRLFDHSSKDKGATQRELDQQQLIDFDQLHSHKAWSPKAWQAVFEVQKQYILSLLLGNKGKIVAMALFYSIDDAQELHLLKIAVGPAYRGAHLARKLLLKSLEKLNRDTSEIYLEVESTNYPAIALYQALGLKTLCRKKNFYGHMRDGLAMGHLDK